MLRLIVFSAIVPVSALFLVACVSRVDIILVVKTNSSDLRATTKLVMKDIEESNGVEMDLSLWDNKETSERGIERWGFEFRGKEKEKVLEWVELDVGARRVKFIYWEGMRREHLSSFGKTKMMKFYAAISKYFPEKDVCVMTGENHLREIAISVNSC